MYLFANQAEQKLGSNIKLNAIFFLVLDWNCISFIFFSSINNAAYFFGILFILQGILFAVFGIYKKIISFSFKTDFTGIAGIIFLSYSLIVYPILGHLFGREYPYAPTFGLPCPTTIFTFGLLLFVDKKISIWLLIIPLLWSVIGFGAALNLSIYEDFGLLVAGISGFVLLLVANKKFS